MADYFKLLSRAEKSVEPVFKGEWATIVFRPDLGSQQEFIIGVTAAISNDEKPYVKWLPSFSKISTLYGEAISSNDARDLAQGSEQAIQKSFAHVQSIAMVDCGTPHVRLSPCGYLATNDIEKELRTLLKRHAYALWQEVNHRESAMDDDWAYSEMKRYMALFQNIFLPSRKYTAGAKSYEVQLDNGKSFGSILSARYSNFTTVEKHIGASLIQVLGAHRAARRSDPPAMFVVLPDAVSSNEALMTKKTKKLLDEIEDAGVIAVGDPNPSRLAKELERWANNSPQRQTVAMTS